MNEPVWRYAGENASVVFGLCVIAVLMLWGGSCEREVPMDEKQAQEIVESVKKLDPEKDDALLVKVSIEINGYDQRKIGLELQQTFPGVRVFIAGPSADLEVVRDKLAKGWDGKKEKTDGEGT